MQVQFVEFPRKPLELVSVNYKAREKWSHAFGPFYLKKRFHKVVICIEQSAAPTLASVVLLEQSRSLSGEFSNRWTSDWYLGFQESELA